ncbi:MAG TPA: hypothetical protein VG738_03200 [Chitinophagaceae bacterium]|nr:hypothetical protein [Chitinophagaceae bacterium]
MKKFTFFRLPVALTLACALFIIPSIHAQYEDELEDITGHWEVSLVGGFNNFFGDLGGNHGVGKPFIKDFNGPATRPLFGASLNYFFYSWLSVKGILNYTTVTGADSLIKNAGDAERWRYYRNLSFRSRIVEGSINAEIYPVMLFDKEVEVHTISPYIGAGIGLFHFNPETYYVDPSGKGEWVKLKPLHTEGEGFAEYPDRKPYNLLQFYIPVTIGLKIYLNNTFAISTGFIFRKTFTDYIDDIHTTYIDPALFDKYLSPSQATLAKALYSRSITPWKVKPGVYKADPNDNDSYVTLFFTLSVRFGGGPRFFYGG